MRYKVAVVSHNKNLCNQIKEYLDLDAFWINAQQDLVGSEDLKIQYKADVVVMDLNGLDDQREITLAAKLKKSLKASLVFVEGNEKVFENQGIKEIGKSETPIRTNFLNRLREFLLWSKESWVDPKVIWNKNPFEDSIFVKNKGTYRRIRILEIMYLEANTSYTNIHLDGKTLVERQILAEFEKVLTQDKGFVRVHRSFLVNSNYVQSIKNESIVVGDKILPVGRTFRESLLDLMRLNRV